MIFPNGKWLEKRLRRKRGSPYPWTVWSVRCRRLAKAQILSPSFWKRRGIPPAGHLCEDTWYTVYDGNVQAEYAQVLGGGAGTFTLEYTVPRGLFQAAGSYRLCVDGLGTVPIDISAR